MAFDDADFEAVPEHSTFAPALATAREVLHNDSPTTAIHERVAPEPGDIIVRKTRFGAFSTTDLAEQLRDRAITTLILAGVSTSGVVLSTVRDAADRDYEVFVLADATADPEQRRARLPHRTHLPSSSARDHGRAARQPPLRHR